MFDHKQTIDDEPVYPICTLNLHLISKKGVLKTRVAQV